MPPAFRHRHRRAPSLAFGFSSTYSRDMATLHEPFPTPHEPFPTLYEPFSTLQEPFPTTPHDPIFSSPTKDPAQLPSRALALNRRCAILSTNLTHLAKVLEPLQTQPHQVLTDAQMQDVIEETQYVWEAMQAYEQQMQDVWQILGEMRSQRQKEQMGWHGERGMGGHRNRYRQ